MFRCEAVDGVYGKERGGIEELHESCSFTYITLPNIRNADRLLQ